MHHIISDSVSSSIILDELNLFYNGIELEENGNSTFRLRNSYIRAKSRRNI